jgi:hypothetical protein
MTKQTHGLPNTMLINRTFVVALLILMALLLAMGYVWIQTDQVIAPPGMRVMDGLWRLFFFWK